MRLLRPFACGNSLRLGTSVARSSVPRKARNRCWAAWRTGPPGQAGWCRCPYAPRMPPWLRRAGDRRCARSFSYSRKCHTGTAGSTGSGARFIALRDPLRQPAAAAARGLQRARVRRGDDDLAPVGTRGRCRHPLGSNSGERAGDDQRGKVGSLRRGVEPSSE